MTGNSMSRECSSSDATLGVFLHATTKAMKEIIKTIAGEGRGVKEYPLIIHIRTNRHKLQAKDSKISLQIRELKVGAKQMIHLGGEGENSNELREEITREKIIEVPKEANAVYGATEVN